MKIWAKFKCWARGYCLLETHENVGYEAAPGLFFYDGPSFRCVCCGGWGQVGKVIERKSKNITAPSGAKEAA